MYRFCCPSSPLFHCQSCTLTDFVSNPSHSPIVCRSRDLDAIVAKVQRLATKEEQDPIPLFMVAMRLAVLLVFLVYLAPCAWVAKPIKDKAGTVRLGAQKAIAAAAVFDLMQAGKLDWWWWGRIGNWRNLQVAGEYGPIVRGSSSTRQSTHKQSPNDQLTVGGSVVPPRIFPWES